MKAGVLKESWPGEARVAVVPGVIPVLSKAGVDVLVESGAGVAAGHPDAQYAERGASVVARDAVLSGCELVLSVRSFAGAHDKDAIARLGPQHVVVGFLEPLMRPEGVRALAARGATSFALDLLPRITRAQSMDALSSTATVVGYKAVLLGAEALPRMLPMLMTAAGTVAPARVFVIGAGVAGLQAIATAKRLGAVVYGYDIRPAARDQIESLGARFVGGPVAAASEGTGGYAAEVDEATRAAQQQALAAAVTTADIVITTAQVPGRRAPLLVTADMVGTMKPGAVLVDVAASSGGNCEVTKPDEVVIRNGVTILGPTDLASATAGNASEMFSRNVVTLFDHLQQKGGFDPEPTDEIVKGCRVAFGGQVVEPRVLAALSR